MLGMVKPEAVAGQGHAGRPDHPADDLPHGERPGGHGQHAGHRVEYRADHGDEPAQHDGLAVAVPFEQLVSPSRPVAQEPVVAALQQRAPAGPADQEPGLGAEQRTADRGQDDQRQRQVDGVGCRRGAQQPGGEQQ